jgi:hypothetical protein
LHTGDGDVAGKSVDVAIRTPSFAFDRYAQAAFLSGNLYGGLAAGFQGVLARVALGCTVANDRHH